uniref:Adipogenin n=1 Tax=Mus musculus TaxID=10090 RepID=A2ACC4_MOUSE
MKYPLVPLSQRKMIQICASTGSPGAKDHLSVAVRRHFLVRRTDSTGDPALPGTIWA